MTVLITGGNGFISSHVISKLLEKHNKVIGVVRTKEKGERLVDNFENDANLSYYLNARYELPYSFNRVFDENKDITTVIHTVQPFELLSKSAKAEIMMPNLMIMETLLTAIKKRAPQVKKFIYLSSYNAMNSFIPGEACESSCVCEFSWNSITSQEAKFNNIKAYYYAITHTEKFVWHFLENEKPNFKISILNPGLLLGPQLYRTGKLSFMNDVILNRLIRCNYLDDYPKFIGGIIDVRDVATAFVKAVEDPETDNRRLLIVNEIATEQTLLDILNSNFPQLSRRLPFGNIGCDKKLIEDFLTINSSKTDQILQMNYIALETTVIDTARQIITDYYDGVGI